MYSISRGRPIKENKVKSVLLYFADKIIDLLFGVIGTVIVYCITKHIDKKSK